MTRGTAIYAAGLGMALLVAGCSVSPIVKRASEFATAATAASKDATNAYQLVEQEHYNAEVERLVTEFGTAKFDLNSIQPFMQPDEMEARTKLIKGLSAYAETLAVVAGDQPLSDMDTQAEAVGKSLKDLSTSDALAAMVKKAQINTTEVNTVTTAVDALGRAIINHQRSSELPALLKEAKTPIATICALLQADIGDPEKSGLRNQLKNDYLTEIEKQEKFIKNTPTLSPTDRQAAIKRAGHAGQGGQRRRQNAGGNTERACGSGQDQRRAGRNRQEQGLARIQDHALRAGERRAATARLL